MLGLSSITGIINNTIDGTITTKNANIEKITPSFEAVPTKTACCCDSPNFWNDANEMLVVSKAEDLAREC